MNANLAAEHLQTIRTLMERAAVYRRALAPVMLAVGSLGIIGALIGILTVKKTDLILGVYWLVIGVAAVATTLLLMRRQALRQAEPFWTPPTRRVSLAMSPCLLAGALVSVLALLPRTVFPTIVMLPAFWMLLYGCALHAAGFFVHVGIRLLGWAFILCGCGYFWLLGDVAPALFSTLVHAAMGVTFGSLHLVIGIWLHFAEKETVAA